MPPILNETVELRISETGRHKKAAGGFPGEICIASSICGSFWTWEEACGGEVMVKPPTTSTLGI